MPTIDPDECAIMRPKKSSGLIRQFEGGVGELRKN
jgi:hypothetical protein